MRKGIILGIGILIILLALAGTASAKSSGYGGASCTYCHPAGSPPLDAEGLNYVYNHNFNGISYPLVVTGCTECHINLTTFLPLTSNGSFYNETHRYNATTLAANISAAPGCANCHGNVSANNFTLKTGTATYLNTSVCKDCHKAKYDNWTNTMHRVILTSNVTASAMDLVLPSGYDWTTNVSYAIIGKTDIYYLNETGYFKNRKYNTSNQSNDSDVTYNGVNYSGQQYNCGNCHTTGYNATGNNASMPGIVGNWSEAGVTCEECHGPGGNGHQVTVDPTGGDCIRCHNGSDRQGPAMTNKHKTAPAEESKSTSCSFCHSPYDNYIKGKADSYATAVNVTCFVCHNPHNTSNDKYGGLLSSNGFDATNMSFVEDVKLSFFNATASNTSKIALSNASLTVGNDIYDILITPALLYNGTISTRKSSTYGTGPINVIGPVSEVLCTMCHYRHGLPHMTNVNLSHGRNQSDETEWATCVDCHMSKAGGKADHSFSANEETNYPQDTCSTGTKCHVTSAQNQGISNTSIVPMQTEWDGSGHNNAAFVSTNNSSGCAKCHSPMNWNTNASRDNYTIATEDYKGVKCVVCHNIHDMGKWINVTGKVYANFNKYTSSTGNYTEAENTTELCGNCHSNKADSLTSGWNGSGPHNSVVPHNSTQKDVFVGSWKSTETLVAKGRKYECADCHIYINMSVSLNDSQKSGGHNYTVNASNLQKKSECSGCHDGVNYYNISTKINNTRTVIEDKWNTTNTTVEDTYDNVVGSPESLKNLSMDKLAEAFYKLYQVKNDGSWGVHDPVGTNKLLDDAAALAISANASLGMASISNVDLVVGWNLVSLNGTPADTTPSIVMNSVKANITVVWGFNATAVPPTWELYDPVMPNSLNSLKSMVQGKGYWIYATKISTWTV